MVIVTVAGYVRCGCAHVSTLSRLYRVLYILDIDGRTAVMFPPNEFTTTPGVTEFLLFLYRLFRIAIEGFDCGTPAGNGAPF